MSSTRNPVLKFLLFTFLFSWAIWLIIPLLGITGILKEVMITFGVAGPAFGAYAASNRRKKITSDYVYVFVVISLLLGLSFCLRSLRSSVTDNNYDASILLASPAAIAIVVINILLIVFLYLNAQGAIPKKREIGWYIAGIVFFPFLLALVNIVCKATGMPVASKYADKENVDILISFLVSFPVVLFLHAGIEEVGWRGYMQEKLQQSKSPLVSALLVGVAWGIWHFPLHLIGFYAGGMSLPALATRLLVSICLSVILGWFFNRSRGSVFTVMLLHTMSNMSVVIFPSNGLIWISMLLISAICFAVFGKMWKKVL